jgi:DNA-binding response OmpR family regulator
MSDPIFPGSVPDQMMSEAAESAAALADARHTLRTPLNHIIGYSEMLLEEAGERDLVDFTDDLQKIHKAGKQLLVLINDFLDARPTDKTQASVSKTAIADGLFRESKPETGFLSEARQTPAGRILVVDDNEGNRDMLSRRLRREGYEVSTASSGHEALARLKTESVDLILLDVMMPGIDGYDTLKELKTNATWRDIPVIMISALDEIDSVVRCIEQGAEDYLPKPFDPVLLRARIGSCLEKKRLRDQEVLYLKDVARVIDAAVAVESRSFDAEILTNVALRADELGQLARIFLRMALEIQTREHHLKQQIQELRIEIDEVKKAQQIADITETDYFQELRDKAKALRHPSKT